MKPDPSIPAVPPRWLHGLAVATVLFTLPLLFLGAGVTSHDVGMVDAQGFRMPWVIVRGLFENQGLGWMLEYGHRTLGFLVGVCGIALALGGYFFDPRPRMGWLGMMALGMIGLQGMLGIFRVDYNALHGRTFALIHGCFAQLVFATLVSIALLLSPRWAEDRRETASLALQRWSILTVLLVLGQLILGGLVRHQESLLGPRGHLLGAFVVVAAMVWLLRLIQEDDTRARYHVPRLVLMMLLTLQLILGVESWLARFHGAGSNLPQLQPTPMHAEWIRTLHYLVGSMIFATTVVVALFAHRKPVLVADTTPARPRELEGVL